MKASRLAIALILAALILAFFVFDLGDFLRLEYLKARRDALEAYFLSRPWQTAAAYFAIYVAVTGLSLPGAAVLTLAGGAVFGLLWGTVIVSFASSIGATLAFLASRFLFRDAVQRRFGANLHAVNRGIERDGPFYLFTLRLVPLFPFFAINLLMGLTPIRTGLYYLVSQVGMLPGTLVYVNAGRELGRVESLAGLLSPGLIAAFVLLGVFPLAAKKTLEWARGRRALRGVPRPRRFDRNLIVIGAGSAGLVAAYIAAAVRAKVTLVEKHRMGGECLNTGCVPSKALIRSARFVAEAKRAREYGMRSASVEFDFAEVMERVQRVIRAVEPHDSAERYTRLGVECVPGEARVVSPYAVEVNGRTLTARNIVIATGSTPSVPAIPGIEEVGYLTSDTVWDLRELPRRLLVLGGGPIGCELAQCFARFGSAVTLVQRGARLLPREDAEFSAMLAGAFRAEGIDLRLEHTAVAFRRAPAGHVAVCEHDGGRVEIPFDRVLVALGRRANVTGFGLETFGIGTTADGGIEVDEYLRTRIPTIYACGDVAGPFRFTHVASHQAWYASVNALFGGLRRFRADYAVIPWCTFTEPEIARVGLNERDARARGIAYEATTYDLADLDRAIADSEARGLVKVLSVPGKDRILGATIAGSHAGEIIAEYVAAMRHGLGLNKILSTIHIYPTFAEANKYAAGAWKRAHAPEGMLRLLERYHAWRRG